MKNDEEVLSMVKILRRATDAVLLLDNGQKVGFGKDVLSAMANAIEERARLTASANQQNAPPDAGDSGGDRQREGGRERSPARRTQQ